MLRRLPICLLVLFALLPTQAAAAMPPRTTLLFVGGYGSSLAGATRSFAPLRSALAARDPNLAFAQFSYTGWDAGACGPLNYSALDTSQKFETSEQRLLETVNALHTQCGAGRVIVIGHSLGGLVAFRALADNPMGEVSDVVTVDSPLGGAPAEEIDGCVDWGFCVSGPVSTVLGGMYDSWAQTSVDNAARVRHLAEVGIRVTAWGNQSDCLYAPAACIPIAAELVGNYDARETQWLGIDRAMRRDYDPGTSLAAVLNSHQVVLQSAATEIAADVLAAA